MLAGLVPEGMTFPLNFGFIPSTKADDGDPLDVMVLHDESLPVGTLVAIRLLGIIEGEQTEDGKTLRNDRHGLALELFAQRSFRPNHRAGCV